MKIGSINAFSERICVYNDRFDVPITAYDVIPYLNEWKLVVVGINNLIRLLRIIS
jgi:hypothetical protein